MPAAPSNFGGLCVQVHLRAILGNIQVLVVPDQFALIRAHEAFDASGKLKDAKQQETVEAIGAKVATIAARLHG